MNSKVGKREEGEDGEVSEDEDEAKDGWRRVMIRDPEMD